MDIYFLRNLVIFLLVSVFIYVWLHLSERRFLTPIGCMICFVQFIRPVVSLTKRVYHNHNFCGNVTLTVKLHFIKQRNLDFGLWLGYHDSGSRLSYQA